MEHQVNIHDPTVTMPSVVERVRHGDEVVLTENGRPIARIIPMTTIPARRVPGLNRGAITVDPSFDEPLPDSFWLGQE